MERRDFLSILGGAFAVATVPTAAVAAEPVPVAAEEPVAFQQVTQRFESFEEMVHSIRAHVARTGDSVLSNDDPKRLMIGFSTDGGDFRWEVHFTRLREFVQTGDPRAQATSECFRTAAGRARFAQFLSAPPDPQQAHPYR